MKSIFAHDVNNITAILELCQIEILLSSKNKRILRIIGANANIELYVIIIFLFLLIF